MYRPYQQTLFVLSYLLALASSYCSTSAISTREATTLPFAPLPAKANADPQALVCFKSQLSDPTGSLHLWGSNASIHFCNWYGVTCSNTRVPRVIALDLENSQLSGTISSCITNLTFLRTIRLQNNKLHGQIPSELRQLQRLQYLNLSTNFLSGSIPGSLGSIPSLAYLDIRKNDLTGQIPVSIGNSSSLKSLTLRQNNLSGEIPPFISMGSSLVRIDLWQNKLSGNIPPSFSNLSFLSYLYLAENSLIGNIPESLGHIQNLRGLALAENKLTGTVPLSIYNVSSLIFLYIGHNLLHGKLPQGIGGFLPNIQSLIFEDNHFEGPIPASLANATSLQVLDLAINSFSGTIPSLGSLENLLYLDFSYNNLESSDWTFLSSLGNCIQLTELCLQSNSLGGSLPSSIGNLSTTVYTLWLSMNRISGTIPLEIGNLKILNNLMMHDNMISGTIPSAIGTLRQLTILRLSGNNLSGSIPDSIGNLVQLNELYLQQNNLNGTIPRSIGKCQNLQELNLSQNSLSGSIPTELLQISSLSKGLDMSYNNLTGSIPQEVGRLINLGLLNISNNQLSNQIPSTLGQCIVLETLQMEGNFLEGSIPLSLMNLRGIKEMDLSRNNLSGEIPDLFTPLTSLQYLNLSFNDFSGAIPTTGVFANASKVSIEGNKRLCTRTPMLGLPICTEEHRTKHKSLTKQIVIPVAVMVTISLSFCSIVLLKKGSKTTNLRSNEKVKVSYEDIIKATNRLSCANIIGSGSFGTVYKGTLENTNNPVAIKVFNLNLYGSSMSFIAECESLRNIRHRNLVKVITSCSTIDSNGDEFKALVFQYMPNGSLDMWLHQRSGMHNHERFLTLHQCISIAADVAFALDYLHKQCGHPLIHCDLKPQNILLDDCMNACVSDFGLARFMHRDHKFGVDNSSSLAGLKGSIGYIAPEYGQGGQISTQGDVYSYGVLLLEILTGKRPIDEISQDGMSLHNFVNSAFPDKIDMILDPIILQEIMASENQTIPVMQTCIVALIKVGLSCSIESPKDRPSAESISSEVDAIKSAFSNIKQ
ncbi:unnamed protein product [Urochloa decumbens]|uniref:Receptor kinase-like protein Xa21 n=1 Tax=Urochloa decumbens TaxID=240449 RepID=A0ABC9DPA6_9POAL